MDPDEALLALAVRRGLLAAAQAGQARAAAAAQGAPLRAVLARALPPPALAELDALVRAGAADRSPGEPRPRLVEGLRAAWREDPRFAPHADLAFERLGPLGEGGMGVVERVRDLRLGREAALKRLRPDLADPDLVARFWREAEVTARLDHPAIPPVYEAGTDAAGRPYLLLRLIEGEALSAAIAAAHAGPRPPALGALRPLLEALVRVGEAVAYAHSRGVLHRDLKPANVMVGRFGEVLVMDWGLARVGASADDDAALRRTLPGAEEAPPGATIAGATLGTPGYLSPEQAAGEAPVDARADVFALGALLVAVLTGRPPVEGATTLNVLSATLQGRIATPRARRPDLPRDLDGVAARALAFDPARRTPDAATFVRELRAVLAGDDVPGHRYGPGERAARLARRRPGLLAAVAVAAVVANVGVGLVASARAAVDARARTERALELLAEAEDLAHRGRSDRVEAAVQEALALVPQPPPRALRFAAARAEEAAGLYPEAVATLESSIQAAPPGLRELLLLHRVWSSSDPAREATGSPYFGRFLEAVRGAAVADEDLRRLAEGHEHLDRGRYAEARAALEAAVADNPRLTAGWVDLAWTRLYLGDHVGATAACDQALGPHLTARERALLLALRGRVWLQRGDAARAEADAGEALGAFPGLLVAAATRALALSRQGRLDEAEAALAGLADVPIVRGARGHLLSLRGRDAEALALVGPLADGPGAGPDVLLDRAELRRRTGDARGALADVERALALRAGGGRALLVRGALRLEAGDLEGAEADAAAARAAGAEEEDARRLEAAAFETRAVTAMARGDVGGVEDLARRGLARDADDPSSLALRAAVALRRGDPQGARADAERAVAGAPRRGLPRVVRASVRAALGDLRGARADIDAAIEVGCLLPSSLVLRGRLRLEEGDARGAGEDATRAVECDPTSFEAYYLRGTARDQLGDAAGARADAEACLRLARPGDPRVEALRRLLGR